MSEPEPTYPLHLTAAEVRFLRHFLSASRQPAEAAIKPKVKKLHEEIKNLVVAPSTPPAKPVPTVELAAILTPEMLADLDDTELADLNALFPDS